MKPRPSSMENLTPVLSWAVSTLLSVLLLLELLELLPLSPMPTLHTVVLCPLSSTSTEHEPKITTDPDAKTKMLIKDLMVQGSSRIFQD